MEGDTVVLCGPASSNLFTTPDSLPFAIYYLVHSLSSSFNIPPATIQTLPPFYRLVSFAPYESCVKAAVHWALDSPTPVKLDLSFTVEGTVPLTTERCMSIGKEEGVVLSVQTETEGKRLLFLPDETEVRTEHTYSLVGMGRGQGEYGATEVGLMMRRVQEETQKAMLEVLKEELER